MKVAVLAIMIVLMSMSTYASCGSRRKAIFFANGMFNDRAGATDSLIYLRETYKKKYPKSQVYIFELAYNSDESLLRQLFEVYRQKVKESELSFWKSIALIFSKLDAEEYRELSKRLLGPENLKDADLREQIKRYTSLIEDDVDVITVAHSQGNLYTLFSFEELGSDATSMVSVATPTSSVFRDGPYFTFRSDGVIKFIPTALPPNTTKLNVGIFDHEFVRHYMGDPHTQKEILGEIENAMQKNGDRGNPSMNPSVGYFNANMTNALKWFDEYLTSRRKLSAGECIVVEAIFTNYSLHGRTCEDRNFATLLEQVHDCSKKKNEEGGGETACPYYSGMDFGNPYKAFYPAVKWEHYEISPQCEMSYAEFKKIRMAATEEALKILESLTVERVEEK